LCALLADGHVLIEDYPGLAKTLIARSFATVTGTRFARVQFTPDLMPSDVTGASIFNQRTAEFEFRPGPVFSNVLLADEINRAPPKTQAALLEAMAERQVTTETARGHSSGRSSCWPRRTRSNTRARIPCPRPSWTGS
jgi:MoxR-like ATPase